jgi:hypothetical protein
MVVSVVVSLLPCSLPSMNVAPARSEGDEFVAVDPSPAVLGGVHELVGHRHAGVVFARALGGALPKPHGREGRRMSRWCTVRPRGCSRPSTPPTPAPPRSADDVLRLPRRALEAPAHQLPSATVTVRTPSPGSAFGSDAGLSASTVNRLTTASPQSIGPAGAGSAARRSPWQTCACRAAGSAEERRSAHLRGGRPPGGRGPRPGPRPW